MGPFHFMPTASDIQRLAAVGTRIFLCVAITAAGLPGVRPVTAAEENPPHHAAVFNFEFVNWSQEVDYGADNRTEIERLILISDLLRQKLSESDRFVLQDTAPLAEKIAGINSLHGCNGCEAGFAREVGAGLAVTGIVNKISNMELSINLRMRDAASGKILATYQADMRGNTDESWTRTVAWLVRNRVLHPDYALESRDGLAAPESK